MNKMSAVPMSPKKKPKRKSPDKKGKKKRSPSKVKKNSTSDNEASDTQQIDSRILKYQERAEEIALDNEDLKASLKTVIRSDKETIQFLEETIKQNNQQVQELTDQISQLTNEIEKEKRQNLEIHRSTEHDFNHKLSIVKAENEVLKSKCNSLQEFTVERKTLIDEISRLESEITEMRNQNTEELKSACREAICDKQKLKNETQKKLNELAEEHQKQIKAKLAEEQKQLVSDNKRLTKEVDSLTNQLTALYVENKQLKASLEAERMENKEFQRSHEKFYNAAIAHKNCKRTQKAQEVKIQEATKAKAEIAKKIEKQRSDFETKVSELKDKLEIANKTIDSNHQNQSLIKDLRDQTNKFLTTFQLELENLISELSLEEQTFTTVERQTVCSRLANLLSEITDLQATNRHNN